MSNASVNGMIIKGIIIIGFIGLGCVMLGASVFDYMKTGEWQSMSVLEAIHDIFETPDNQVAAFFSRWIGLAKMLHAIPAFLVPFGVAVLASSAE
ncbi:MULTISPECIES: hypothetical protein [Rhizobium]|uniref:Uncharacterized protein n=1 Tax=Rhizobium esperanzae TaxID=1967781 RepID=A0A7W6XUV8_9HYPH|nr:MULTISPECIES: hypothetical protein [Rhizobium]MBB4438891.1 hypothetical protein [Rhizobium esperanzae]MDH6201331.1 hypothetical protein [Rhizobium leguminosarum]